MDIASTIHRSVVYATFLGCTFVTVPARGANPNRPMSLQSKAVYNTNVKRSPSELVARSIDAAVLGARAATAS